MKPMMRGRVAQKIRLPAPVGGLNAVDPVSDLPAIDASEMVNFYPAQDSVQIRKGSKTLYAGTLSPLSTIMVYDAIGAEPQILTAGQNNIYKYLSGGVTIQKNDLSSAFLSWCNFGTPGGQYLYAVNGANVPFYYNGTAWSNASITGVTPADLIFVMPFKKRLFFIIKNSLKFAYLDVLSIAGAATDFNLSSLFSRGGILTAITSFSINGGDGMDDIIAFISSKGQVALYQGDNPSDAASWALVGIFDVGQPIGNRFIAKIGGDAILLTNQGILSLSDVYRNALQAKSTSIARKINPLLVSYVNDFPDDKAWFLYYADSENKLYVNVPQIDGTSFQYVMNAQTGAWTQYQGMALYDMAQGGYNLYGVHGDKIKQIETGFLDDNDTIMAHIATGYSNLGIDEKKLINNIQPFFKLSQNELLNNIKFDMMFDFQDTVPQNEIVTQLTNISYWDEAVFDVDRWSEDNIAYQDINAVGGLGHFIGLTMNIISPYTSFKWNGTVVSFQISSGL